MNARLLAWAAGFVVVSAVATGCAPDLVPFTFLQADVSAADGACDASAVDYGGSLCARGVEVALRDAVTALAPDVVALEGVLPDAFCDDVDETDAAFSCGGEAALDETSQAARLLPGYVIACGDDSPTSCIGVRRAGNALAGEAEYGVKQSPDDDDGSFGGAPLPDGCHAGFNVGRGQVLVEHGEYNSLAIFVAGLERGDDNSACRDAELAAAFATIDGLGAAASAIVAGGFNTAVDDIQAPVPRLSGDFATTDDGAVVDAVFASASIVGTCDTLGESAGTTRLDGGSGTAHRALFCTLTMPAVQGTIE